MSRVYISGPMTGLPDLNFPAFNAAAERLRGYGHETVNPADTGIVPGWTWDDYMHHDVALMRDCDGIYLLPGWRRSRGAVVEYYVALALGMRIWGAINERGAE